MSDSIFSLITGVIIIAIIFMLVKPGSQAGQAIIDLSGALTALVKTATANPSSEQLT